MTICFINNSSYNVKIYCGDISKECTVNSDCQFDIDGNDANVSIKYSDTNLPVKKTYSIYRQTHTNKFFLIKNFTGFLQLNMELSDISRDTIIEITDKSHIRWNKNNIGNIRCDFSSFDAKADNAIISDATFSFSDDVCFSSFTRSLRYYLISVSVLTILLAVFAGYIVVSSFMERSYAIGIVCGLLLLGLCSFLLVEAKNVICTIRNLKSSRVFKIE